MLVDFYLEQPETLHYNKQQTFVVSNNRGMLTNRDILKTAIL